MVAITAETLLDTAFNNTAQAVEVRTANVQQKPPPPANTSILNDTTALIAELEQAEQKWQTDQDRSGYDSINSLLKTAWQTEGLSLEQKQNRSLLTHTTALSQAINAVPLHGL